MFLSCWLSVRVFVNVINVAKHDTDFKTIIKQNYTVRKKKKSNKELDWIISGTSGNQHFIPTVSQEYIHFHNTLLFFFDSFWMTVWTRRIMWNKLAAFFEKLQCEQFGHLKNLTWHFFNCLVDLHLIWTQSFTSVCTVLKYYTEKCNSTFV